MKRSTMVKYIADYISGEYAGDGVTDLKHIETADKLLNRLELANMFFVEEDENGNKKIGWEDYKFQSPKEILESKTILNKILNWFK